VTQADLTTVITTYNGDGTVHTVQDAGGALTTYGYDNQGRRTTAQNADNQTTTTHYDANGYVTSLQQPSLATTTYTVDPAGEVTAISYSGGTTPNVSNVKYDADGRRISMTDGSRTISTAYDAFGEVQRSTNGAGASVGYTYNNRGGALTVQYPDGTTVTNGYDIAGQLTSVNVNAGLRLDLTQIP
jgi:YD repeat-containing protein